MQGHTSSDTANAAVSSGVCYGTQQRRLVHFIKCVRLETALGAA